MKAFVRGDIDGFFALGLDNMLMLILMSTFCLGFPLFLPPEIFFAKILPATAIGVIIGNVFYARMALKLADKEQRDDVCAIPYGINLLTVFVYVFLVMFPAKNLALAGGATEEEAAIVAWQAGMIACLGSGLIEFLGAFVVGKLQQITPRAALLAALAGIGLFFISADFIFRAYAYPFVGLTTLAIVLAIYFGGVRFKFGIPGGLVILVLGSLIAWGTHHYLGSDIVGGEPPDLSLLGFYPPWPVIGDLIASFQYLDDYLPIIIPMGFINLVLSLQNLESASAAGDTYEARPALTINGLGTIAAACLGSAFPTTVYIGHPGWKALGARAGYSTLTAIGVGILCVTGSLSVLVYFVPLEAGMAILIWIGLMMCTQAFEVTPKKHLAAVAVGLLPAIGAFAAIISKNTLRAGGYGSPDNPFPENLTESMAGLSLYGDGMFGLEAGYVYTSLILAAATVAIIERQFWKAAIWFLAGAALSAIGFMHTYEVIASDVVGSLGPTWKWVIAYLLMAAIMVILPFVTERDDSEVKV